MTKFITSPEANRRIAELETIIAKGGTSPINAALDPSKAAVAVKARLAAGRAALAAAEARAQAKIAAAAITPGLTTAEEWRAQNAPPTLSRAEWQKLNHLERGQFFQKGGKLAP